MVFVWIAFSPKINHFHIRNLRSQLLYSHFTPRCIQLLKSTYHRTSSFTCLVIKMEPRINDLQVGFQTPISVYEEEKEADELVECPFCINQMSSAIYQCPNGHTIYSPRKARAPNYSCISKNVPPYRCPYSGSKCTVTGEIQYLLLHLTKEHNVEIHDGCSFSHRYVHHNPRHLHHATWMLTLLNCFGRQFCLYFQAFHLKKAPMYIAFIQFMGDEEEASSFSYTLEVSGNGRKLKWQGVPRSIRDSHKTVRDSQDGLIIPCKLGFFFSTQNTTNNELNLKVLGRVWREQ